MDLQKSNQELITGPPDTLLVKVPEPVYEFWWDTAYEMMTHRASVADRQKKIFSLLQKWVEKDYPSYGIVAFQDYSKVEALQLSRSSGKTITWGMYVLLQIGGSMQPISITDKLLTDEVSGNP
jgi:hypothetical protein